MAKSIVDGKAAAARIEAETRAARERAQSRAQPEPAPSGAVTKAKPRIMIPYDNESLAARDRNTLARYRERILAIFSLTEAQSRPAAALQLVAENADLTADEAKVKLAALPAEVAPIASIAADVRKVERERITAILGSGGGKALPAAAVKIASMDLPVDEAISILDGMAASVPPPNPAAAKFAGMDPLSIAMQMAGGGPNLGTLPEFDPDSPKDKAARILADYRGGADVRDAAVHVPAGSLTNERPTRR